ncbi:hypothetical protein CRUP_037046, partial [Coryphaenoides rupestris]
SQVRCELNHNGTQTECELGNPVKRDSTVRPISEQPDLAPVKARAKVVIELPLSVSV